METIGSAVELVGTLITGCGLVYAWNRLTGRFTRLRVGLAKLGAQVKGKLVAPGAIEARAITIGGEGTLTASARAVYPVNSSAPLEDKVARLIEIVNALRADIDATNARIDVVRDSPVVTIETVGSAVAEAVSGLEVVQASTALRDLGWAMFGILVTAVGIVLGMVA
ncbi:hypothetical protein [Nocardia acidivorans]|uniref:hypothetical protein n=1 Tax=Nocardia acidivorans TaxID=404580 RepID=UPI0008356FD5|nr:hypothetical protein [Nocardia acidivorans]